MGQLTTAMNSQTSGTSSTNNAGKNMKEVNEISVQHIETEVVVEQEELSSSRGSRGKKGTEEFLISDVDISMLPYPQLFLQINVKSNDDTVLENSKDPHTNIHVADMESESVAVGCSETIQRKFHRNLRTPEDLLFHVP